MTRRAPARSSAGLPVPAWGLLLIGLVAIGLGFVPAVAALTARTPGLTIGTATLSIEPLVATAALWCGGFVATLFGAILVAVGGR